MFRPYLYVISIGLLFSPMLDATIKGTGVLLLACAACRALRRDSAATRHMVWATAVMLVLAMPLLSILLPKWRVLPNWSLAGRDVALSSRSGPEMIAETQRAPQSIQSPHFQDHVASGPPQIAHPQIVQPRIAVPPKVDVPPASPAEADSKGWQFNTAEAASATIADQPAALLATVWLVGCGLILMRLPIAFVLLRKSAARCRALAPVCEGACSEHDVSGPAGHYAAEHALRAAMDAAAVRLRIRRSIQLLLDPQPSMPVVWGLLRTRMRLPAEAVDWSAEQQQSVLLHELAHIRRNDLAILTLTQFASALNWFNPLMWIAAWRLHVERERACDDLVLSAGVRPSTYAGHLVEVVNRLRPMAWTRSCGLAMARHSSLEQRLAAVLSRQINHRGLTRVLVTAVLALGTLAAIPIAMLHAIEAENAKEVAGRPAAPLPPPTREPTVMKPKHEKAFKVPGGAAEQQNSQTPKVGTKLSPGIEKKLQWGAPVNGLRAALVRPQALGDPKSHELFDFDLVVQNVSPAAIRFSTSSAGAAGTSLTVREKGVPMEAFDNPKAALVDFTLQPREVAVMRLFPERTEFSSITEEGRDLTFSANLKIETAPAGTWTGKLVTADTSAAFAGYGLLPKHKDAQPLFKLWSANARGDGKIPGALIGQLAESVRSITKYNPTSATTPQLLKMLPRFDATHDWSGKDALALLDELAAVESAPIWAYLNFEMQRTIITGAPLPPELANAPWGKALPNGLRLAWLLEPRTAEHRLGTPLKSRILIHNSGKGSVVFRTRAWHQCYHTARDAKNADIKVDSVYWTTIGRLEPYRLAPGEFVEVNAPGIGVGAIKDFVDPQNDRVGTWVEAQAGDEVTLTAVPVPLSEREDENPQAGAEPGWWLDFITARLARERPLHSDAAERTRLLYHVAMDLFGTPLGADDRAAFIADQGPGALDSLAKRLAHHAGLTPYSGSLTSGPTKFRVLPADPDAAKRPRNASNPGHYTLAENTVLAVTRRPLGERIVNEATIQFHSPDSGKPLSGGPHEVKLPDGYDTWATAWVRGGKVLWLQEKGGVRRYDFSDPAKVKEEAAEANKVPVEIREALRAALPGPKPAPKGGANGPPAAEK
jgi:hypothetical protein